MSGYRFRAWETLQKSWHTTYISDSMLYFEKYIKSVYIIADISEET